jgi:hypothetical protein
MCEIHEPHHTENQRNTDRAQRIKASETQRIEEDLKKSGHQ